MAQQRPRLSKLKKLLIGSYGPSCIWCGCSLDKHNSTADHVRCQSEGGSHWLGNLLPACLDCNQMRADTSAKEWLQRCLDYGWPVRVKAVEKAIVRAESDPRSDADYYQQYGRSLMS